MDNSAYLLALHGVDGLGPLRLKKLLEVFKDPKEVWNLSEKELLGTGLPKKIVEAILETKKKIDPQKFKAELEKSGLKWITIFDEHYPALLKQIYDPPVVLYYLGDLPDMQKAVAIVGTRKVSAYGRLVTEKFAKELVSSGVVIVSGLARGVDSVAHRQTILSEGQTIAVLGGGLKKIFPAENEQLAKQIASGFGAVISEFAPDAPSLPGNFPVRNRIIAGLCVATLVTEAAIDSGSLITARLALEEGRDVFAVPGPINSSLSQGSNLLIKEGAKVALEPADLTEGLGFYKKPKKELILSEEEKLVISCLENEPKHLDLICRELKLSSAEIAARLLKMEIGGLVKNLGDGTYCLS